MIHLIKLPKKWKRVKHAILPLATTGRLQCVGIARDMPPLHRLRDR